MQAQVDSFILRSSSASDCSTSSQWYCGWCDWSDVARVVTTREEKIFRAVIQSWSRVLERSAVT